MSEGNTILNGLAKVISPLFLEAVGGNLYLRTASDKSVLGPTATQRRDEPDVYSKSQVDNLLAVKANKVHSRPEVSGTMWSFQSPTGGQQALCHPRKQRWLVEWTAALTP